MLNRVSNIAMPLLALWVGAFIGDRTGGLLILILWWLMLIHDELKAIARKSQ